MFAKKQLRASGTPIPKVTLNGSEFDGPQGLAFDAKENLWVANYIGGQISKISAKQLRKSGSPTPPIAITGVLENSHQMTFRPIF